VTGYFGKVSTRGDFVGQRLPPDFSLGWDQWLQRCLQLSRDQLGSLWLARYLTSPVWRFALAPGILGEQGWGGVMMPSVDRVGRHFPLMLAAPGAALPLDWFQQQARWYDALEDLARASLEPNFELEALAEAPIPKLMAGQTGAPPTWHPPVGGGMFWSDLHRADLHGALAMVALQGHSLWWSEGSDLVTPSMLVCRGLPRPDGFAAMLEGSWSAYGWQTASA
jgi:type VI secretion system protein ImpM